MFQSESIDVTGASNSLFRRISTSTAATIVLTAMLLAHGSLLAVGAWVHSPTYNEPAHLAAGISYWQLGRFDVYSVNPPLVKLVAAIPVMIVGCETNWEHFSGTPGARDEMNIGRSFGTANRGRIAGLITIARWSCIPFCILGAVVCYRWSHDLYGTRGGLFSLCVWCFCPNILAHGQLITSDAASAALGVLACYSFWKWLKAPNLKNTVISGLTLGVAESAKTTLLIFYPLWPILWILYRLCEYRQRKQATAASYPPMTLRDWMREGGYLVLRMMLSVYVLNMVYGFEGTMTPLKDFHFVSSTLGATPRIPNSAESNALATELSSGPIGQSPRNRFEGTCLGAVPMPFPKHYILGIDIQRRDFEKYHNTFYLNGTWSEKGWWYYYLAAATIKIPIGILCLILFASITFCVEALHRGGSKRLVSTINCGEPTAPMMRDELYLLAPAVTIFAFVSSQTGINEHFRYVLPVFPFVYVFLGRLGKLAESSWVCRPYQRRFWMVEPAVAIISVLALIYATFSSLWVYPHSLSYFNEIIGGPSQGGKYLLSSNIDWGQDLLLLKRWQQDHLDGNPLFVDCVTGISPTDMGITSKQVPSQAKFADYNHPPSLEPGWYAISVDKLHREYGNPLLPFASMKPQKTIGYSIHLYLVPGDDRL